MTVIFDINLSH